MRLLKLLVSGLALLLPSVVTAGTCNISGGKVELNVLFLYNETDLDPWKSMLTEASKLLYNATEGNLQIGTVNFYVACQPAKDKSDVWISTGTGGASAHVAGCGVAARHVFLSNIHKRNDASAKGHFGLVHELGHYIFALSDEYGGAVKNTTTGAAIPPPGTQYMWQNSQVAITGGGVAFFCQQTSGGTGCIMDGGTTVTSAHSRTEFCSASNHIGSSVKNVKLTGEASATDRTIMSEQQNANGAACWGKVKSKLGIATAPDPPSTTAPAGHQALVFRHMGTATRYMLTIDTSGSMLGSNIVLARAGANIFVDSSRLPRTEFGRSVPGDELGLVSFESFATLRSPLTAMATAASQTALKGVVNSLNAGGSTNIGGGLRLSLNQFAAAGDPGCSEAIVLLSDGQHNTGEAPGSVLPALTARKSPVYSIGLGSGADALTLGNIAAATGGKYYFAGDASVLPAIFSEIQAVSTGAAVIDRVKKTLSEGGTLFHSVYFEPGIPYTLFNVVGSGIAVTLRSPTGQVSDSAVQAPGVTFTGGTYSQLFRVTDPSPGEWVIEIRRTGFGSSQVELTITGASLGTHLEASAPTVVNFTANPGAKLLLRASVSQGPAIVGANVTAYATRPDGSNITMRLVDNGDAAQGDAFANDGEYSGWFTAFNGSGSYTFTVRANTEGAYLVDGEQVTGPTAPVPAVKAIRAVTVTTNVINPPVVVVGDVNGDGRVDCFDIAIVRGAFRKRTGQPGFDARADVVADGIIDVRDLAFVSQRLAAGTVCP